jgi:hypothetical protein
MGIPPDPIFEMGGRFRPRADYSSVVEIQDYESGVHSAVRKKSAGSPAPRLRLGLLCCLIGFTVAFRDPRSGIIVQ